MGSGRKAHAALSLRSGEVVSFLSVLKKIGTVVTHTAVPIGSLLYPPAGPYLVKIDDAVQHLLGSVIATEENNPSDGLGSLKSDAVNANLNGYIDTMNAGLALANKKVQDDPTLRQEAINAAVASFNAAAKWKASFKVVDL